MPCAEQKQSLESYALRFRIPNTEPQLTEGKQGVREYNLHTTAIKYIPYSLLTPVSQGLLNCTIV